MMKMSEEIIDRPEAFGKIKGQVSYAEFCVIYCMLFVHDLETKETRTSVGVGQRVMEAVYREIIAGKKAREDARRLWLLSESRKETVVKELGSMNKH